MTQTNSQPRKELEEILLRVLKMSRTKAHLNQRRLLLKCNLVVRMTQTLSQIVKKRPSRKLSKLLTKSLSSKQQTRSKQKNQNKKNKNRTVRQNN